MFREQLPEDRIRFVNRLHWELKIYFPEYKEALGKVNGVFSLELLKEAPFPAALLAIGEEGNRQIWRNAKLKGRGYSWAKEIIQYAEISVGVKDGANAGRQAVKWFVEGILEMSKSSLI